MSISVHCECGKDFTVPEERAGKPFNCYLCGRNLVAPVPEGLVQDVLPAAEIDVQCACGKQFKVPPERAGVPFKCFVCGRTQMAPPGPAVAVPPADDAGSPDLKHLPPEVAAAFDSLAKHPPNREAEIADAMDFAYQRLAAGDSRYAILRLLEERGVDPQLAQFVVDEVSKHQREAVREQSQAGQRNMLFGAIWFLGGVAVTVASYNAAAGGAGGGRYVIAWGAIVFGAIQFVRGMVQAARE